jgi:signal transduction histidine kinase
VQRIASELRPGLLDNIGLSAAIEWQATQFQERTGVECDIICEPHDIVLNQTVSTTIFRVFQEALTNIARHAAASRVEITLKKGPEEIELVVCDNGRGITEQEIADPKSFGLMGIRERVHSLAGEVKMAAEREGGTTVAIRIPLSEDEEKPID